MTHEKTSSALQTIFAFFLGLMTVAFVGVGVNTFYPSTTQKFETQEREISRRLDHLNRSATPGTFTPEQQAEFDRLEADRTKLAEQRDAANKEWARVTSIVIVLFATLVLVISLLLAEQLRVIANGLLLGGLFSMVYGVGWVLSSGNSMARFWVIVFALCVSIALGYVRFVRDRKAGSRAPAGAPRGPGPDPSATVAGASLDQLSARVAALEERASAAAAALGGGRRAS